MFDFNSSRPTIDSTLRSIYANHIQQQSNLMPKKCGQQYNQQAMPSSSQQSSNTNFNIPNTATTTVMHRKSHSLDATNILQPSSLNNVGCGDALTSSLTTNGGGSVGPGVGLNGAALKPSAIHASATTNSQNNMAER